jgi:hypothetical protein
MKGGGFLGGPIDDALTAFQSAVDTALAAFDGVPAPVPESVLYQRYQPALAN